MNISLIKTVPTVLLHEQPLLKALGVTLCNQRYASKKTSGSTKNQKGHGRPKHRGWKRQDGHWVEAGTILATQLNLRFHPGLNVGFGKNGTLFAMVPGRVMVTCEKTDLNWDHTWVQRCYAGRENQPIYKKYFNVIPEAQHQNFKLIDQI
ncbi:50S ribosomal protein L27 [Chrysoperla carnea]|uniref:50S ribosomal protein L27 n=1 Tax=Chrysoperla carnea TaxID=189513 RepID=UPI001D07393F|nr:50S ribosomal protein L27 [Chrysoperla carnea]